MVRNGSVHDIHLTTTAASPPMLLLRVALTRALPTPAFGRTTGFLALWIAVTYHQPQHLLFGD